MRRAFIILLAVVLAVVISIPILLYRPRYGETGEDPVIDATLVDNGEHDYIVIKFISAGTQFFRIGVPIRVAITTIEIRWDNNSFTFTSLPPENLFPGENVEIAFNADVVQAGKEYNVFWNGGYDEVGGYYTFGGAWYQWPSIVAVAENV